MKLRQCQFELVESLECSRLILGLFLRYSMTSTIKVRTPVLGYNSSGLK